MFGGLPPFFLRNSANLESIALLSAAHCFPFWASRILYSASWTISVDLSDALQALVVNKNDNITALKIVFINSSKSRIKYDFQVKYL